MGGVTRRGLLCGFGQLSPRWGSLAKPHPWATWLRPAFLPRSPSCPGTVLSHCTPSPHQARTSFHPTQSELCVSLSRPRPRVFRSCLVSHIHVSTKGFILLRFLVSCPLKSADAASQECLLPVFLEKMTCFKKKSSWESNSGLLKPYLVSGPCLVCSFTVTIVLLVG